MAYNKETISLNIKLAQTPQREKQRNWLQQVDRWGKLFFFYFQDEFLDRDNWKGHHDSHPPPPRDYPMYEKVEAE